MLVALIKVIVPLVSTFVLGVILAPSFADIMYRNRLIKRSIRSDIKENPGISAEFSKIHNAENEKVTPRVGGVVIWVSVLVMTILMWIISHLVPREIISRLDFLSRSQTWLLFFALIIASLIGLVDDLLQIFGGRGTRVVDGLSQRERIGLVMGIGFIAGLWFVLKLDFVSLYVPFVGSIYFGWLMIVMTIMVVLATYSGGIIDGIDGLAGGVFATAFTSYAIIAFTQNQIDIAAFSASIAGGILAFLWFNIPPARFYLGETGTMGLTITLALIAFLTDQVFVLPIVAFPLVLSSGSAIIQRASRKWLGKKVFKVAPLHHHFLALGWSREKVTMRFWIIALISGFIGVIVTLLG